MIDPGGSYRGGRALREAIRARTALPIRYVIMTHVHPDHIFGAAAFRDDHPDFVGHAKLPGALAQRGEYYLRRLREALGQRAEGSEVVLPTAARLLAVSISISAAGDLMLWAHGPAHTDNDLTIFDEKTRTFWLADLLFVDRIPVVDGSLVGWLEELAAGDRDLGGSGGSRPRARSPCHGRLPRRPSSVISKPWRARPVRRSRPGSGLPTPIAHVAQSERTIGCCSTIINARNVTASYKELEWE